MIVPFPPGGGTDQVARILAQHLQEALGQPVAVENRGGASGIIGTEAVARATPDGYTLAMTASGPLSILPQMIAVSYDPIRSFEHVAIPSVSPLLMVQPTNRTPRDVRGFVAWANANRGRVNYCSIGVASPSHLAAEMFLRGAGIEMTHIPHRGSGPGVVDAIAGNCDVLFDSSGSSGPHVRGGRLVALGITSAERNPGFPDLPTIAEQGIAGLCRHHLVRPGGARGHAGADRRAAERGEPAHLRLGAGAREPGGPGRGDRRLHPGGVHRSTCARRPRAGAR